MADLTADKLAEARTWYCKIGEGHPIVNAADGPMRQAIAAAYREVTGVEPDFIFSGWGAELTESERAVVEDREPDPAALASRGSAEHTCPRCGCPTVRTSAGRIICGGNCPDATIACGSAEPTEDTLAEALRSASETMRDVADGLESGASTGNLIHALRFERVGIRDALAVCRRESRPGIVCESCGRTAVLCVPETQTGGSAEPTEDTRDRRAFPDLIDAVMTVLENMRVTTGPMRADEMTDIEQRRVTALNYLSQIGTHRAPALIEYVKQRTDRDDVLEALAELEQLVMPRPEISGPVSTETRKDTG